MDMAEYEIIPTVNAEAEFFEILNDFGNPLEVVREAISNAIDAGATEMDISFGVEDRQGSSRSVLRFIDNGRGMTEDVLRRDFWGLAGC
jgi:signal transduction histidine kinase